MPDRWEEGLWHWCSSGSCLIEWADHWQTMITGVMAVGAAYFAVRAAREQIAVGRAQIKGSEQQAAQATAAKLRAARASLPATLSAVCDYAENTARLLNGAWPTAVTLYPNEPVAEFMVQVSLPAFPPELLSSLERIVELTTNEAVADRIEGMLREVQVLTARCRPLQNGESLHPTMLAEYILQAASIYARAASLFEYARKRSDTVDPTPLWTGVAVALSVSDVHRDEVLNRAQQERAAGLTPGEADLPPEPSANS